MGTCPNPAPWPRTTTPYSVTFSRAQTALIERCRAAAGLGKSEFFQTLLAQAVGARLPVVTPGGGK